MATLEELAFGAVEGAAVDAGVATGAEASAAGAGVGVAAGVDIFVFVFVWIDCCCFDNFCWYFGWYFAGFADNGVWCGVELDIFAGNGNIGVNTVVVNTAFAFATNCCIFDGCDCNFAGNGVCCNFGTNSPNVNKKYECGSLFHSLISIVAENDW